MEKSNSRFIVLVITFILGIIFIQSSAYAANENSVIVKEDDSSKYMIYLKDYLTEEFEFAFSNNKSETEENLTFINSALDEENDNANQIAYVDNTTVSMFENPTYMWIREDGKIEKEGIEIDIKDNILKSNLEKVSKTSKNIPIKLEQKVVEDTTSEEGLRKTTTVGMVKVLKDYEVLRYQLIKRTETKETDTLFALAELIEKNEFTDSYTQIKASKEFIELYNEQYSKLENPEWKNVKDKEILQPEETKTGDQYILWVESDDEQDIHFLTSYRQEDEEWIKEEIKTVLPYTYDNNTLLIVLVIVIVAIVIVTLRIKSLNKKEVKK